MIATVLSLFPWLFLGLNATLRSSKWNLVIFLTVQNLGSAMADVVVDAMIAEAVRSERPMAWLFIARVTVPNLSTVMFYYQTQFLKLEASFLGTARAVGQLGPMLGTFIYNRYLKKTRLRKILTYYFGVSFVQMAHFGMSDRMMVLCGSALAEAINQFKFMPFLILSGKLCPPGIERTLFALFMSINNLGFTVGSFVGAELASILNISSGSFDNLLFGVTIQVVCTFIPIAFLFLIPKEASGVST